MLPNNTKTSPYTQNGCSKYLGYQPLKDLDMERSKLRKTTIDCVEDCGYDNLSLSRVMAMVFSRKSTLSQYVGNVGIYSVGRDLVYQI